MSNGTESKVRTYQYGNDGQLSQRTLLGGVSYGYTYDAWGKRTLGQVSMPLVTRGYTGHEHLDELGLINMNGRLYDFNLGRFLSPDNFVQSPSNPQNYNRYSYCLNNPLKYTDPDGEYWHLIVGGIIGGFSNWISHACEFSWKGFWYFNVGALAGVASAAVGGGINSSLAGGSFWAGAAGTSSALSSASSFISGACIGGGAGSSSCFITEFGNSIVDKKEFSNVLWHGFIASVIGGTTGALLGGLLGGIDAYYDDRNFLDGKIPQSKNDIENEVWGEIALKARLDGDQSSLIDGHAWIELTDSNGNTTSYGTWGNQGEQELLINYKGDLFSESKAIQTQTITNAQRLRFDRFINNPHNQKWTIMRNCSYFASKAYYYTTGINIMAHPFSVPIYNPYWLVKTINNQ